MELEDRKRLRKRENYCELVRDVKFCVIQDYLYSRDILNIDQVQEIENVQPKYDSAQIKRLITILERNPKPGLLCSFCEILKLTGWSWIAEAIEQTNTSEVPEEDLVDSAEVQASEKSKILGQQISAEISSRLSIVELKLEQLLYTRNQSSEGPLMLPDPVEGWDMVDARTSKRFVNKCLQEFIRKPRKSFSMIEKVACRLGLEVTLNFSKVPLTGDIAKCDNAMVEYVLTMRRVVKHMAAKHADILKECLDALDVLEINGYRTVDVIADALFQDDEDVNWGRIICWFTFWGQFVKYLHVSEVENSEKFVKFYGEFIGFYLAKRLHLWIAGAGGWVSSKKSLSVYTNKPIQHVMCAGALVRPIEFCH